MLSNPRHITSAKKLELVTNLIQQFRLPWNDAIVGGCFNAIEIAVRDHVQRIQSYFLVEGSSTRSVANSYKERDIVHLALE